MKRILYSIALSLLASSLPAQQLDNPVVLPVSYYGEAMISSPTSSSFSFGASLGATTSASVMGGTPSTMLYSPVKTVNLTPGKVYTVNVTASGVAYSN